MSYFLSELTITLKKLQYQFMNTEVVILTSRKNFSWISMEEIISWIEESWITWAREKGINYVLVNADNNNFTSFVKHSLSAKLIVVTCFNTDIARYLVPLREKLAITTPWVYYLHGLASYGCWPLFFWKIAQSIRSHDVFIGSCQRDREQFNLIFKNIPCEVIPFSFSYEVAREIKKVSSIRKFAFIGRITSQKNLHTLLLSLATLRDTLGNESWEMHFFGREDNYGSPLMGRRETNYLQFLLDLVDELHLSDQVFFHGFKPREEIEQFMEQEQWTFIAPSIHSDENFGMAAFRCLVNGHRAILSDWGGHHDFQESFTDALTLLPVYKSEIGPFIDIHEMTQALNAPSQELSAASFPLKYSKKNIQNKYELLFSRAIKNSSSAPAKISPLINEILSKREFYLKNSENPEGIQIYESYQDPLMNCFFDAYGQIGYLVQDQVTTKLCPWVKEYDDHYLVRDPHRGEFILSKSMNLRTLGLSS